MTAGKVEAWDESVLARTHLRGTDRDRATASGFSRRQVPDGWMRQGYREDSFGVWYLNREAARVSHRLQYGSNSTAFRTKQSYIAEFRPITHITEIL